MIELLDRLRDKGNRFEIGICMEAADEIERLSAAKAAALKVADERSKENVALRATDAARFKLFQARNEEIERLQVALRTALCPGGGDHVTVGQCASAGVCGCELGAALARHPEQEADEP